MYVTFRYFLTFCQSVRCSSLTVLDAESTSTIWCAVKPSFLSKLFVSTGSRAMIPGVEKLPFRREKYRPGGRQKRTRKRTTGEICAAGKWLEYEVHNGQAPSHDGRGSMLDAGSRGQISGRMTWAGTSLLLPLPASAISKWPTKFGEAATFAPLPRPISSPSRARLAPISHTPQLVHGWGGLLTGVAYQLSMPWPLDCIRYALYDGLEQ